MALSVPREHPLTVVLFDKGLRVKGVLEGYETAKVDLHLDAVSTATFTIPTDHPMFGSIGIGDRVVVYDEHGEHLLSGPCTEWGFEETEVGDGGASFTFQDDWRLFARLLGWVQPGKGIDQQASDDSSAQWSRTGPAETVIKAAFGQNATRFGLPVTVAPDLGRGGTIRAALRMTPIADAMWPALTLAGVGARIRQVPNASSTGDGWHLEMDCWTLPTRPMVIERGMPMVSKWQYREVGPEALKGVVGGQGSGNARTFRAGTRPDEIDRVGLVYGGEIFNDSRQESTVAGLDRGLADELAAKAWSAQSSLSLVETAEWRYGVAWRLGDLVKTQIDPTRPVVAVPIVSVSISDTPPDGSEGSGYVVTSTADVTSTPLDLRGAKELARRTRALQGA